MTDRNKSLAALLLSLGAFALGVFGFWFTANSTLQEPDIDHAEGAIAAVAFVLVALALLRRSWARLPLLVAGFIAWMNAWDAFFVPNDPSEMTILGYFFGNAVLIVFAGVAVVILAVKLIPHQSAEQHLGSIP